MGRIVTAIIIFIVIIGLTIGETAYTVNVSEQVKSNLNSSMESYLNKDVETANKKLNDADQLWNESTMLLDVFLIHDNTENISEKISTAKSTLEYNPKLYPIECKKAVESLNVVIYAMLPYFDNVL